MAMIERKNPVGRVFLYCGLLFLAILCIVPFYIMIINGTRSNVEISQGLSLLPSHYLVDNYRIIMDRVNIWGGFRASSFIAVPAVLLSAFFSTLTAYGFAKFRFKGREALFWIVLGTMMIPQQLGVIGYYDMIRRLGMIDTYWPLFMPNIANAAFVFFVRAYIESSIPDSLVEAALIDGAGEFYIFWRLVFPLSMPAVATQSIFTFIYKWNDLINPLILLNSVNKMPMPVVVSNIRGLYESNFGAIYLGVSISVIPILVVVITFSRSLIRGLTVGAVKG